MAHHTECTFIRVSGSELVQKFIGEGSRMVRELFVMAREHAPSIIFMDEIDSIGSSRIESGSGGGDSEVQRTMLELLNQLDGFEATKNIKVIMATNRIDILDSALLRPGITNTRRCNSSRSVQIVHFQVELTERLSFLLRTKRPGWTSSRSTLAR